MSKEHDPARADNKEFQPTPTVDRIDTTKSTVIDAEHYTDFTKDVSNEVKKELELIGQYRRLADYIAVAQIYLKKNCLVSEPLKKEHIKTRLLGHWGTCPGINMVYIHCNRMIVKHNLDMFIIVGPGHGAPAVLSNLFLEGSLYGYYPQYSLDYEGATKLIQDFSVQGGFPSHVNPQCPGSIHEGGELGYALAVSYGAIMDNPDLIVTCLVGDGESETGPTATAWHSHKYIDPVYSGAVIPILHLNGFKISSPTIYGTMSDEDLIKLFGGYGYTARIVGTDMSKIDLDLMQSMEWCYKVIKKIQDAARGGKPIFKPLWPMIVLRTPKGIGCMKELHGHKVEGTFLSHQVPAKDVLNDDEEFKKLEEWLRSYKIEELFDKEKQSFKQEILDLCPKHQSRMGMNKHTNPKRRRLELPDIDNYETEFDQALRGEIKISTSPTVKCGEFLADVIEKNPGRFRIFSPDELESNKLHATLKKTNRCYQWHEQMANRGGYVVEMLSEHTMQGFMQGYVLTGRCGLFPSYEAFLGIITTMVCQYGKFKKMAMELSWKNPTPSINYIESSTLWRQEHNGFSHQNPGFINSLINLQSSIVRIFLPPDSNCLISTINHCIKNDNYINLIISTKNESNNWLNMEEAKEHCRAGASIWRWAGNETDQSGPDIILACSGNEVTTETIAAAQILMEELPEIVVRLVNITDLMVLDTVAHHPHGLSPALFNSLFPDDIPVIYNFHGYPSAVKQLIFDRPMINRFKIHGYSEKGTTTTPFNMLLWNKTSRYHVAISAIEALASIKSHKSVAMIACVKIAKLQHLIKETREFIEANNEDPKDIYNFKLKQQKKINIV